VQDEKEQTKKEEDDDDFVEEELNYKNLHSSLKYLGNSKAFVILTLVICVSGLLWYAGVIGAHYACERSDLYFRPYPDFSCWDINKHPECSLDGEWIVCVDDDMYEGNLSMYMDVTGVTYDLEDGNNSRIIYY